MTVKLTKKYGELNIFMRIMLMTKISLDMWIWWPFHNKSGVIVRWKMFRRITICKCTEFCNKATDFCLKTKLHWKGNVQNILLYSVIFFTKFDLHNTAFQSLLSLIARIWELFCDQLEANLLANFYDSNGNLLFHFVESFF